MYLMTSTRCGISAKQLERELGVTYKTAWRMFNKIRNELMAENTAPLSGEVEMDETFVGGRRASPTAAGERAMGWTRSDRLLEPQSGRVRALSSGADISARRSSRIVEPRPILPLAHQYVLPGSMIFTDE